MFEKSAGSSGYGFVNTLNKCFMDLVVVGRQSELCVFWCMASAVCFFIIFQYFKGGMSYEKIRCKNFVIIAEFNYGGKYGCSTC